MENLLLLVFLGLFVVVHPTPANSVNQIPAKLDEDIYHEVKAEEFIVDPPTALSGLNAQTTTESGVDGKVSPPRTETPKTPAVIESSQQLYLDVTTEGSGGSLERGGHSHTTPLSVSDAQTPTALPGMDRLPAFRDSDQPLTDFTTEGSADPTSSMTLMEGSGFSPSATTIQTSQQTFTDFLAEGSGTTESATIFEEGRRLSPTATTSASHTQSPASTTESVKDSTVASPTSESTKMSTKTGALEEPLQQKNIKSRLMQGRLSEMDKLTNGDDFNKPNMRKGHITPDWIIIVAFVVALAALLAVCAAIATRDKWNHPNQVVETKTPSSNQKRELEMQTVPILFQHGPKENGSNGEYTVIPLDDITENFPSH